MNAVDVYLCELLLHVESVLDGRFRVDGIQEWKSFNKGNPPECYLERYSKARWWIFVNTN